MADHDHGARHAGPPHHPERWPHAPVSSGPPAPPGPPPPPGPPAAEPLRHAVPPPASVPFIGPGPMAAARPADVPPAPSEQPVPVDRKLPRHATWATRGKFNGLQALSVWTEQVAGHGEDAEPFVVHHWESHQGMIAVFDGLGGAGAAPVWEGPDGLRHTGAWVGSRVARLATDCWFRELAQGRDSPENLHTYLSWFLSMAPQRRSKIGGTMRRQLPTTLAGVHYRVHGPRGTVELRPLWTGDSRAYVLTPTGGLQVLTRDHTHESDALELLRSDPPMTNIICADREFTVDTQHLASFDMPCVLIAATDGYFGYVHTPADFEHLLLSTLRQADNEYEWADLLRRGVQEYTGDDASLALLALGHGDFASLVATYEQRYSELTGRHLRGRPAALDRTAPGPGDGDAGQEDDRETHARVRAWQDQSWQTYRAGYETYLPSAAEEYR
ncbi:serine/threonine protein phosphatase [Streptomyces sp. NPDC048266]|uniref:serine/threonine protein phosphatase n=1 Tax=unclassified Streptomyces TaxID=2593676 RepID=UPI0034052AB2